MHVLPGLNGPKSDCRSGRLGASDSAMQTSPRRANEDRRWTVHHPAIAERRVSTTSSFTGPRGQLVDVGRVVDARWNALMGGAFVGYRGGRLIGPVATNRDDSRLGDGEVAIDGGVAFAAENDGVGDPTPDDDVERVTVSATHVELTHGQLADRSESQGTAQPCRPRLSITTPDVEKTSAEVVAGASRGRRWECGCSSVQTKPSSTARSAARPVPRAWLKVISSRRSTAVRDRMNSPPEPFADRREGRPGRGPAVQRAQ